MIQIILTIHVLIVLALIGIVLLQRSEGGALGMGGGGSGGGFMTSRGAANALTRTTSVLAALFFATSISLAIFADRGESETDLIRGLTGEEVADPNEPLSADDLTRTLGGGDENEPGAANDAEGAPGLSDAPDLSDALGQDALDEAGDALNVDEALDEALGATDSPDNSTDDAPGSDAAPAQDDAEEPPSQ